jgi:hypothetical protein
MSVLTFCLKTFPMNQECLVFHQVIPLNCNELSSDGRNGSTVDDELGSGYCRSPFRRNERD